MTARTRAVILLVVWPLICATGARADFVQVDTSFGVATALHDNTTGVSWLHNILTTNISYNDMIVALQPGGKFYGWRYATPDELTRLFADYTGTADGIVVGNDALAIKFMADLGGPTEMLGGRVAIQDGRLDIKWDLGHADYAIIRTDTINGAKITPVLQGSGVDWFASPYYSHWLVRQDLPTPVPEPGCLALLGGGLWVVIARRYVRKGSGVLSKQP